MGGDGPLAVDDFINGSRANPDGSGHGIEIQVFFQKNFTGKYFRYHLSSQFSFFLIHLGSFRQSNTAWILTVLFSLV